MFVVEPETGATAAPMMLDNAVPAPWMTVEVWAFLLTATAIMASVMMPPKTMTKVGPMLFMA
jgi:hypothetical protein